MGVSRLRAWRDRYPRIQRRPTLSQINAAVDIACSVLTHSEISGRSFDVGSSIDRSRGYLVSPDTNGSSRGPGPLMRGGPEPRNVGTSRPFVPCKFGPTRPACAPSPPMAICVTMEYLAVAQMPRRWSRTLQGTLLRRGYRLPRAWHAVPTHQMAPVALCGFRYTREPHRTWRQTMIPRRCPKCQRLVEQAESNARDPSMNPLWAVPSQGVETHGVLPAG